jgi:hypothetical protein
MSNEELIAFLKKNPVGLAFAVLSLGLFGGWYYRGGEVPVTEAELAQKQTEGERYALNLTNSAQLQEQFDIVAAANKEIEERLVRASQINKNYQFFFKLEADSGAKLVGDPRQSALATVKGAKGAFVPVSFGVTVSGDYAQVLKFLQRLESGVHYCRVLSATCSVPLERNLPLTLSLNLDLLGVP